MDNLEEDIKFIGDETLDFSVPSPSDSREEEEAEEPGIPERPPRRGLAHRSNVNTLAEEPQGLRLSLGPLSPEKLEEILAEANRLAARLEQCALQERDPPGDGKGRRVKASPRRETFVIKNSPVRALLPTVSSSVRGASSPGGLSPRLRSGEKKGPGKALRAAAGKKPPGTKKEVPAGSVLPSTRSQSAPLSRITPPARGKVGPSSRAPVAGNKEEASSPRRGRPGDEEIVALFAQKYPSLSPGPASTTRPALALQHPPSALQRPARTQGPASRLPTPTAIPKPASQALLSSRSPLSGKGALPPESTPPRKGPLRPGAAAHRVSAPQKSSLPVSAASRNPLQFPKKVTMSGLSR